MHDRLLARFVRTFQRAIDDEMAAMRRRLGTFELPLGAGSTLDFDEESGRGQYRFALSAPTDKLMVGMECSLRIAGAEQLVSVVTLDKDAVVIRSPRPITPSASGAVLVVYPWFLYEKLKASLGELRSDRYEVERGLALFGALPYTQTGRPLLVDHSALNASQQSAVQLASDCSLGFLWGPPGTGKTRTLAHVVEELLAQEQRLLVVSTTHAAVDQALAQMTTRPSIAQAIERGEVLRLGHGDGDTHGAGLGEVVRRLHARSDETIRLTRERIRRAEATLRKLDDLVERIGQRAQSAQTSLFESARDDTLRAPELFAVFGQGHARRIGLQDAAAQRLILARRAARLMRVLELGRARIARVRRELSEREAETVSRARAVLTTLTGAYFSRELADQRFDAVIVDEASMAVLPSLFYAACLARRKTVMVGDPRQLPPIVQSDEPYVRRAMGRSIFEVTVPDPASAEIVVMLDTQYRMHPEIGELVSRLFYGGRLRHGAGTEMRAGIAECAPYPGRALLLVDTSGTTRCTTRSGSFSRLNEGSAELCVRLAGQALEAGIASIAVITPYADQAREIRRRLDRLGAPAGAVECSTVHRFQGHERDMVIFDTVDAPPLRPGVLLAGRGEHANAANLINVSLSRARGKLVIVSDVDLFRTLAPQSLINAIGAAAQHVAAPAPLAR